MNYTKLPLRFLQRKMAEYEKLREEIDMLKLEADTYSQDSSVKSDS